jgi:hypothetical protein
MDFLEGPGGAARESRASPADRAGTPDHLTIFTRVGIAGK